jgi:hypothetical protein
MRNAKTLMVALLAVFAFSAIAASAASAALPEFSKVCRKVTAKTGEYPTEAACTKGEKAGEEPREWERIKFTSSSGPGVLETVGGDKVKCESDTNVGTITGPKKAEKIVVHFFNCTGPGGGECHSTSPLGGSGEIITNSLVGTLKYITAPETELTLEPEAGKAAFFTTISCIIGKVPTEIKVKGAVPGVITPLNKLTKTFTLTFTQSGGVQTPSGSLMVSLAGGAFEGAGLATTDTLTMSEEIEVKA